MIAGLLAVAGSLEKSPTGCAGTEFAVSDGNGPGSVRCSNVSDVAKVDATDNDAPSRPIIKTPTTGVRVSPRRPPRCMRERTRANADRRREDVSTTAPRAAHTTHSEPPEPSCS